jgi:tetratricopeptide (TPR) repeat protein
MDVSPNLRFSNSRSFRLFTEGVLALQTYEQNAQKTSLDKAAGKLAECVSNYKDVLPRLYLGIVRYYQGEAVDEAISLLTEVLGRGVPELIPTAKYYLAEAYVSQYTTDSIEHASNILKELLSECKTTADSDPKLARLLTKIQLQAEILQVFALVRQNLWKKRTASEDLTEVEEKATQQLNQFNSQLQDAVLPDDVRSSLSADYENTCGLLEEFRAYREKDEGKKRTLADKAVSNFKEAARYGANKADAESNQARVYHELLNNDTDAIRLAKEVLKVRENDSFANLLLGRIYESKEPRLAVYHYRKAQPRYLEEAAVGAGRCYEKLKNDNGALNEFGKVAKLSPYFGEASYRTGLIQARLDKTEEARASFERVPEEDKKYHNLAQEALASLPKKN